MYSPLSDLPIVSNVMWGDSTASRKYQLNSNPQPVMMQPTVHESSTSGVLTPPVSPSEPQPPIGFKMPSMVDIEFREGKIINIKNCNNVEETIKYMYVLYNKTIEQNAKRNSQAVAHRSTPPTSPFHDIFQLAQEGLKPSHSNGRTMVNNSDKTVFSYDYLVFLALLNAPTGRMTVTEMYPFVQKYFYNFGDSDSWKSSIRHAVNAKHRYFLKDGVCGKSAVYKIDPAKMEQLHNGIRKIVEKNQHNPEALRLRNINDLTSLLNGTAEFTSETHLVMRNQKPNVPARGTSMQVHVASPYFRPDQVPKQQYAVQTNLVPQNQPWMNQYLPEFYNQQINYSLNQPMLPHSFNMAFAPGSSMMFQAPLQSQFQEDTVEFATENNEFVDNMVQFEEAGAVGYVIDENIVHEEFTEIEECEVLTEEEYFEIQENKQFEFVDDVQYTEMELNNFQ